MNILFTFSVLLIQNYRSGGSTTIDGDIDFIDISSLSQLWSLLLFLIVISIAFSLFWADSENKKDSKRLKEKQLQESCEQIEKEIIESKKSIYKSIVSIDKKSRIALEERISNGEIRKSDIKHENGLFYFKYDNSLVSGRVKSYKNEIFLNFEIREHLRKESDKYFLHGKKSDYSQEFNESNYYSGRLSSEGNYVDGKKHGLYRTWHSNGNLAYECFYKDNELHGEAKTWYEKGNLESICNYKENKLFGTHKQWYENGHLESEGNYKENEMDDFYREWDEDGKLIHDWT